MNVKLPGLYEILGAYADSLSRLEECENDEEFDALYAQIESISSDVSVKGESMGRAVKNMQAKADMLESMATVCEREAEYLRKKAQSFRNRISRIKSIVAFAMESVGMQNIRTSVGTWYMRNSVKVDITDPAIVPEEFITRYDPRISKDAIAKHSEATGEIVPGTNVTIRREARFR